VFPGAVDPAFDSDVDSVLPACPACPVPVPVQAAVLPARVAPVPNPPHPPGGVDSVYV
jgi:hypothetical protein